MGSTTRPQWLTDLFTDMFSDVVIFAETEQLMMFGLRILNNLSIADPSLLTDRALEVPGAVSMVLPDAIFPVSWADDFAHLSKTLLDKEANRDFPSLRSYGLIYYWNRLENFVTDLLTHWIDNEPTARCNPKITKLLEQAASRSDIESDQKSLFVVDRLERQTDSRLKKGVQRFECVLDVCGLNGSVNERTSKHILELHQLRNVIVHNRGAADQRLIDSCPWLNLRVGEKVFVDQETYRLCYYALNDFLLSLLKRTSAFYGVTVEPRDLWKAHDAISHR